MIEENEIPKHRRKKKKNVIIQERISKYGIKKLRENLERTIKKRLEWSTYSKYETVKDAETALNDINKKKSNTGQSQEFLKQSEYRIIDFNEKW